MSAGFRLSTQTCLWLAKLALEGKVGKAIRNSPYRIYMTVTAAILSLHLLWRPVEMPQHTEKHSTRAARIGKSTHAQSSHALENPEPNPTPELVPNGCCCLSQSSQSSRAPVMAHLLESHSQAMSTSCSIVYPRRASVGFPRPAGRHTVCLPNCPARLHVASRHPSSGSHLLT